MLPAGSHRSQAFGLHRAAFPPVGKLGTANGVRLEVRVVGTNQDFVAELAE